MYRPEAEQRHYQNALDMISKEGLLCIVKVMGDWMRCNTSVIMTCAQVCMTYVYNGLFHLLFWNELKRSVGVKGLYIIRFQ